MADDVICLSSESSRSSSPFINISEVFNDSERHDTLHSQPTNLTFNDSNSHQVSFFNKDYNETLQTKFSSQSNDSPLKNRAVHDLSDSSENEESENIKCHTNFEDFWLKYGARENEKVPENALPVDVCNKANTFMDHVNLQDSKNEKKLKLNNNIKMTKEQRLEEKLKKQAEKEKIKAEKLASRELKNQMKPGNCVKYMSVVLDSTLVTCTFGGVLLASIQSSESKCEVSNQDVPFTISWTREIPGPATKEENDVVLIWQWHLVIPAIKNHTLCQQLQEIQTKLPSKTISLVIYGLNCYFSYLKSRRRSGAGEHTAQQIKKKKTQREEFPYVTRKEIEEELVELQIMANCNHRIIERPEELGQFILQITKAIAETPFKLDKQQRELKNLEWFAVGDSRDCVAVDKAGNGLLRLWQQQLCQFNLAGHDVAQAIASVYPSPLSLVQAYEKCNSQKEGEALLKDIPVRRCTGPLSSSRRVGPELSKKVYTFFFSTDGDAPLSQE